MALNITSLHPSFVGEVRGIDVRLIEDRTSLDDIRVAMDRYGVLVFREQAFTDL